MCGDVKQVGIETADLFGIYFAVVLIVIFRAISSTGCVINLNYHADGGLVNQNRLKANIKTRAVNCNDLLYAGDASFVIHSEESVQTVMDSFSASFKAIGLTISIQETKTVHYDRTHHHEL